MKAMTTARKTDFPFHLVLAVVIGSTAMADMEIAPQIGTNSSAEGRAPRRWAQNERLAGEQLGERLIDRLLANVNLTTELGLNEDTVAKLREESHTIQARQVELDSQIRQLSLNQADRMSKLLLSDNATTNEVMRCVEEIGRLRMEQAKLAVQNLMVVRKYLTPDQIRKARELMRERMQKNGEGLPAKREKSAPKAAAAPPPKPPEGW